MVTKQKKNLTNDMYHICGSIISKEFLELYIYIHISIRIIITFVPLIFCNFYCDNREGMDK